MVKRLVMATRMKVVGASDLKGLFTYTVRCGVEEPGAAMIANCQDMLMADIISSGSPGKPFFILAFGKEALSALNFKVGRIKDTQGKFLETRIADRPAYVFSTVSIGQIMAKSGFMDLLDHHAEIFFRAITTYQTKGTAPTEYMALPITQLSANYRIPATLAEVREIVEEALSYVAPGAAVSHSPLSIDTETNTLNPHKAKLKLLSVVFSWAPGRAASIPVEHAECPWTLEDVFPHIDALLSCAKPKVLHHGKFDLRVLERKGFTVNNLYWDTLIGEHLVSEDKTGYYGLKALTTTYLPKYAGYEDDLKGIDTAYHTKNLEEDNGYAHIPLKALNLYGACDADVTRLLARKQIERMRKEDAALEELCGPWRQHDHPEIRAKYAKGCSYVHPLENLMTNLAMPLTRVLARMESHGFPVDREYAKKLSVDMDVGIANARNKLLGMVPTDIFPDFNFDSGPQLRQLLFHVGYVHPETKAVVHYRDLPADKLIHTEKGDISVNAAFLKYLHKSLDCPFAASLLEYRTLSKARSTFIENIYKLSEEDGRMHTTFNITGTATGRLSSSNENMQNIPSKIKAGGKEYNIKKMFIPTSPDMVICNADAKAAEVRLYAAYSKDANLIRALCDGLDPHSFFASVVYNRDTVLQGVPEDLWEDTLRTIGIDAVHDWSYADFEAREKGLLETDPAYAKQLDALRKNIKRVVFGILYGASKNKISSLVGIPDEQAQAIIDVLFRMFPTIPKYIDLVKRQVRDVGVLETLTGRRRRFNLKTAPGHMKARAERQGVNFKIQSTSSDIVMDTLCAIDQPIRDLGGQMLITVHDSLVFQVPKKNLGQVPALINRYCVERVATCYPWLPVPFQWDVSAGPSYGEQAAITAEAAVMETLDQEDVEVLNSLETV